MHKRWSYSSLNINAFLWDNNYHSAMRNLSISAKYYLWLILKPTGMNCFLIPKILTLNNTEMNTVFCCAVVQIMHAFYGG